MVGSDHAAVFASCQPIRRCALLSVSTVQREGPLGRDGEFLAHPLREFNDVVN